MSFPPSKVNKNNRDNYESTFVDGFLDLILAQGHHKKEMNPPSQLTARNLSSQSQHFPLLERLKSRLVRHLDFGRGGRDEVVGGELMVESLFVYYLIFV